MIEQKIFAGRSRGRCLCFCFSEVMGSTRLSSKTKTNPAVTHQEHVVAPRITNWPGWMWRATCSAAASTKPCQGLWSYAEAWEQEC